MADFISQSIRRKGAWCGAFDRCVLTYEQRFFRRKVLVTAGGQSILVDLEHTKSLDHGDALELEDGRFVEIIAAREDILIVTGENLLQLAWHIGNRHTPCQIEAARLVIQADPVIKHMLEHLGAEVAEACETFTPESGAYGVGRTLAHSHGATAHEH